MLVNHVSDGFIRHIQIFGNVACGDFHALCGQHVYCGFQTVAALLQLLLLGLPGVHGALECWQLGVRGDVVRRVEALHNMDWVVKPHVHRFKAGKLPQCALDAPRRHALTLPIWREFQFDDIKQRVNVAGKHTATAGPVHAVLPPLVSLAMVVAIDNCGTAGFCNAIKPTGKLGHLVSVIFTTSVQLIKRVNNNRFKIFVFDPAANGLNEVRPFDTVAAQIPDC